MTSKISNRQTESVSLFHEFDEESLIGTVSAIAAKHINSANKINESLQSPKSPSYTFLAPRRRALRQPLFPVSPVRSPVSPIQSSNISPILSSKRRRESLDSDVELSDGNETLLPKSGFAAFSSPSPLSPTSFPTKKIIKIASPFSPATPNKRASRYVTPLPATPVHPSAKRMKREHADFIDTSNNFTIQSFGKELPFALVEKSPVEHLKNQITMPLIGCMYQLPSGQNVAAIQQPIQEKPTCGPGCVLMIGLRNMEKLESSGEFWNWYSTTRLANGVSLLNGFRYLEMRAKVCKMTDVTKFSEPESNPDIERKFLDPKDAVSFIRTTIQNTENSVILAITHPILKGHWIIVDDFHNECALIRDPYTGKAFALPVETLSKWLLEKDKIQEMVYFPRA